MSLAQWELDLFIKEELEVHFCKIDIIQNTEVNPKRYSGPGTVSVKDGRIEYILHHALTDEANDRTLQTGLYGEAGQVITAEQSFRFSGIDVHGRKWDASETDTHRGVLGRNGAVVIGELQCLRTEKKSAPIEENYVNYLIAGNGFFPRRGAMPEGRLDFTVQDINVCASVDEYGCELSISGSHVDEVSSSAILKVLEMVSGCLFQVRAVELHYSGACWMELRSINSDLSNRQLHPPLELSALQPGKNLEDFFSSFYGFFLVKGEKLYDYWYQLNRAWQGGFQAASLSICIFIEGMLREYFGPQGQDAEFHKLAEDSLSEVSKLKIDTRVIELLKGSIRNAGQFKAKTALHLLEKNGAVSKGLPGKWTRLRNDSAHGVRAGEGYIAQQRQLDLTFNNLKLFYEIIFHLGGYEGSRIDYGTHGFPNKLGATVQRVSP